MLGMGRRIGPFFNELGLEKVLASAFLDQVDSERWIGSGRVGWCRFNRRGRMVDLTGRLRRDWSAREQSLLYNTEYILAEVPTSVRASNSELNLRMTCVFCI
jgi:hypothetical protein